MYVLIALYLTGALTVSGMDRDTCEATALRLRVQHGSEIVSAHCTGPYKAAAAEQPRLEREAVLRVGLYAPHPLDHRLYRLDGRIEPLLNPAHYTLRGQ